MSDEDFVDSLAEKIKARGKQRHADWQRSESERRLKRQKASEVFPALQEWLRNATGELQISVGRPVVKYEFDVRGGSFKLIGEGSDANYVEVVLRDDGNISYNGLLVPDGRAAFLATVENGDHVRYYGNDQVMLAEDMGKFLLSLVTR